MLDAGGGSVYLKSHRGQYLAIREDQNWGPGHLDERHLSNKKDLGCLGLYRDYTTHLHRDCNRP